MPAPSEHHPYRQKNFFGRRKTRALTGRKQNMMERDLPLLRLDLRDPCPKKNLNPIFAESAQGESAIKMRGFRLEIGFGGGEHLAWQARENPNIGFIGAEPFINGMAKMLGRIADDNLRNIRLHDEDATLLLDWLADECLDRIDLLYPDPWPKKRNWKRRFVNEANLARMFRVLKPGGDFFFASDIDSYIAWTLRHIRMHRGFEWSAETARHWRDPPPDWIATRYEAKAKREGRAPCYLHFIRKARESTA